VPGEEQGAGQHCHTGEKKINHTRHFDSPASDNRRWSTPPFAGRYPVARQPALRSGRRARPDYRVRCAGITPRGETTVFPFGPQSAAVYRLVPGLTLLDSALCDCAEWLRHRADACPTLPQAAIFLTASLRTV
jgi:hypothetical protein